MRRLLHILILLVALIILPPYLTIASLAQRAITPAECGQFSLALLGLMFGTRPAEAHPPALALMAEALHSPSSEWHATIGATSYQIPLPPYTVPLSHHPATYITFATPDQLHTYYATTLPSVGWTGNERMGAAHFFYHDDMHLDLIVRYYWSSLTSEVSLSLNRP